MVVDEPSQGTPEGGGAGFSPRPWRPGSVEAGPGAADAARKRPRTREGICVRCGAGPVPVLTKSGECRWCHASRSPMSIEYGLCHARVRRWRGRASEHACVSCGRPAEEWAYRDGPTSMRISGVVLSQGKRKRMVWSPNPGDYDPLCRPCHGWRDRGDYGAGYRSNPETLRAKTRQWSADSYARQVSTEAGRAQYRERKRAERARRRQTRAHRPDAGGADA